MHDNPRKVLSDGHTQANSQIQKNIQKRKLFRIISGEIWIVGFWSIPGRVRVTFKQPILSNKSFSSRQILQMLLLDNYCFYYANIIYANLATRPPMAE